MTNGEKLCEIFPDMHYTLSDKTHRVVTTIGVCASFDIEWWNSEYKAPEQEPILDKIKAEVEKQERWLFLAGLTTYNVDIAFNSIKAVLAESEE